MAGKMAAARVKTRPMTSSTLEEEILQTCKLSGPKHNESFEQYAARLVRACNALDEEQWESMSESAQSWVNGAIAVLNRRTQGETGLEIPGFPDLFTSGRKQRGGTAAVAEDDADVDGNADADHDDDDDDLELEEDDEDDEDDEEEEEQEEEEQEQEEEEEEESRARPSQSKARKIEKAAPEDAPDARPSGSRRRGSGGGPRTRGVVQAARMAVLAHPDWTVDQVIEHLSGSELTASETTVKMVRNDARACCACLVELGLLKSDPFGGATGSSKAPGSGRRGRATRGE